MPKATWGDIEGSPWDDDLDDFPIYDGELPPKGVYRLRLKMLRLKENSNGDPMLNGLLIVNEPAGSKKSQYNGYDSWFNLNVTSQGARWVNNFLTNLVPEAKVAAVRKAFWQRKVMIDKGEPPAVLSIGVVKITEDMLISAQLVPDTYNGDTRMIPKQFLRPTDTTPNEDESGTASDDEDEEWEESGAEEAEGDGDEDLEERAEELEGMTLAALKKVAKEEHGAKLADYKTLNKEDLVEWILDREFPEDEESEEEDEEDEDEEDEEIAEEEEEEREPAPKRRTRATAAKAAPAEEEGPPARTRTGTRRRRAAADGKPPF